MLAQRTALALRQATLPSLATRAIGRRMESTSADPRARAKLVFRFGPRDVPIELWPMGAVVCAGIVGAGFALSRHLYKDGDLRLHRNLPGAK